MAFPSTMYVGETYNATGTYGGSPTLPVSYLWSGAGLTFGSSTSANSSVTPTSSGTKSVTLTVTSTGGCSANTTINSINVCSQVTSVSISPGSGATGANIQFIATINGGVNGNTLGGGATWTVGSDVITFSGQNVVDTGQTFNIGGYGDHAQGFYLQVLMPGSAATIHIGVSVVDCKGATLTANIMFSLFSGACVAASSVTIS